MNQDINFLGTFADIASVWASYPEGGHEGDYLNIGTVKYRWNKYDQIWENAATVTESTARKLTKLYADVLVNNDLRVGGTLYYHRLKGYDMGLYSSLASLQSAHPSPNVGMWAFVVHPSVSGKYQIYMCSTAGEWALSVSETTLDILDFERYEEAVALMQEIANGGKLTGYRAAQSVSDLPTEDVDPTLGWIVGNHLYIYVEEGGDTLDGLYQDCGEIRGPQGPVGPKGNDGTLLDPTAVTVMSSVSDLDGKTNEQKDAMIAGGRVVEEIGKNIHDAIYEVSEETENVDLTGQFEFTDGKGVNEGGDLSGNNSNFAYSNIVILPPNTQQLIIRIPRRSSTNQTIGMAFYSSGGGYGTTDCVGGKKTTYTSYVTSLNTELYTLNIPTGATHLATSWFSTTAISSGTGTLSPFSCVAVVRVEKAKFAPRSLSSDVNDLENDMNEAQMILPTVYYDITQSVTPGNYYVEPDGTRRGHSAYSQYSIKNSDYSKIRAYLNVYHSAIPAVVPIAFYDSDGTFLSDASTPAETEDVGFKWYDVPVPSKVATIRITHRTNKGTPYAYAYGVMNAVQHASSNIAALKDRADYDESVSGMEAIYNRRAGMKSQSSTFDATVFSPFVKQPEITGKRVCAKCVMPRVALDMQGGALYGNLFVCANTTGDVAFIDIRECRRLQFTKRMINNPGSHNNAAFFGTEFYDENDTYPIIYFSASDAAIHGYRITLVNGVYGMTLVQTINMPSTAQSGYSSVGCNAYLYDGSLFVFGAQTGAADHRITMMKFPMPALSDGSEVTLDMDDKQEISPGIYSMTFSEPNAMQGGFVRNSILYCCYNVGGIFAIDLSDGTYLGSFSMYTAIHHEPETCFMWNGDLYVLAINRTNEVPDGVVAQIYYVELLTV